MTIENLYPSFNNLNEFEKFQIIPSKYMHLMNKLPDKIIGFNTNTKVIKGKKKGFYNGIVMLPPYKTYPYSNICPMAEINKCHGPCLSDAGMGKWDCNKVARFRKLALLNDHPDIFEKILIKDIEAAIRKAKRENLKIAIRLNGTSDLNIIKKFGHIIKQYENIYWYDYTKVPKYLKLLRRKHNELSNYHLTFSYSKVKEAQEYLKQAIKTDTNIAMVIKDKSQVENLINNKSKIKLHNKEYNLINGDNDDLRFLDPKNSIVLLRYKDTRASKQEIDNFIVDTNDLPMHIQII